MADGGHFEKMAAQKACRRDVLCLDRIQILCCGSLGISDDLINFNGKNSNETRQGHFEKNG